jgi:hypothetical protein
MTIVFHYNNVNDILLFLGYHAKQLVNLSFVNVNTSDATISSTITL